MILVDTSVLIRATGEEHPNQAPARWVLEMCAEFPVRTTVEVIQEFLHVRARKQGRPAAGVLAVHLTDVLQPIPSSPDALLAAIDLYTSHPKLDASDALLLGTARVSGATAVIADDRGFSSQRLVRAIQLSDRRGFRELFPEAH